jgi:inner membrane protein
MPDFMLEPFRLSRPIVGILIIGGLVLMMQVPVALIRDVIGERVATRNEAVVDVTRTWGGPQSLVGPRLVVPYRRPSAATDPTLEPGLAYATFLPTSLSVKGELEVRSLSRGLFAVPVYDANLTMEGTFEGPDLAALGLEQVDLASGAATLVLEVSDPRAVGAGSEVSWNGSGVELLPGAGPSGLDRPGIHVRVDASSPGPTPFRIVLELKGAEALWFVPFSQDTRVELTSDWSSPSFAGSWLPTERSVSEGGFAATWRVPYLGRDYPQQWTSENEPLQRILNSRFGTELVSSVDHYRMSERSTKYAALFLTLTFGLLWLFDARIGVRVHPIQYLLVGAAMCLFYLLELSLSEHIGFTGAYTVAALAIAGLVAAYAVAVLRSTRYGAVVGGALGLLYAYLFALLALERYALLAGSLGLFGLLAAVMHQTRWIDWYREPDGGEGEG